MKTKICFTFLFSFLFLFSVLAQAPQGFNYQAVVRDNQGNVMAHQKISFRISILQGSTAGSAVYTETHADTTNQFGLVNLEIGSGSVISGAFSTIAWRAGAYYLQVEMDQTGGTNYQLMGTSKILSVPYALMAKEVENVTETDPVFGAHVSSGINTADLTNWNSAYNWGDHSAAGYITGFSETDPVFGTHLAKSITSTDTSNWNTAFRWGDHSTAGYMTGYSETDPVFGMHLAKGITSTDTNNWNTAFRWGDHSTAGYMTGYTETDPVFGTHLAQGITSTDTNNWNTAFRWGDHSMAGYLTGFSETDPVFGMHLANGITSSDTNNWNTAFRWGDHSMAGYLTSFSETDPQVGTISANYLSRWDGNALVSSSVFDNGNVGIGSTNPAGKLHIEAEYNTTNSEYGNYIDISNINANADVVYGLHSTASTSNNSIAAYGIYGQGSGNDFASGVFGEGCTGLRGISEEGDGTGNRYGGYMLSMHEITGSNYGLYALANSGSDNNYGVFGEAASFSGTDDGPSFGVVGRATGSKDNNHYGGYFYATNNPGNTAAFYGVAGLAGKGNSNPNRIGVYGSTNVAFSTISSHPSGIWAGYFDGNLYISDTMGIGTTNPSTKLEVNGTLKITDQETLIGDDMFGMRVRSNSDFQVIIDNNANESGAAFRVLRGDGSYGVEIFRIRNDDGFVGVGITNPSVKLDVDGDISANKRFYSDGESIYYDSAMDKFRFSKRIHSGTGSSGHFHTSYQSSQATRLDLWNDHTDDNRYSYISLNHFLPSTFTGITCTVKIFYMISGGTDGDLSWYYAAGATAVNSSPTYNIASWLNVSDNVSDNTVLNEVTFNLNDTDLGASKNLSLVFEPRDVDDDITNIYIMGYYLQYNTTGGTSEVSYSSTAASYSDTY